MKEIILVPLIGPHGWTTEVDDEFAERSISTHHRGETFNILWEDEESFPFLKAWLINYYGKDIKNYDKFAIDPT